MFKLVVLCVFASAVAEPQTLLYGSSLTLGSYPAVVPAATIAQPGLIAQASPLVYSSPYGLSHFIKKRSADAEPEPEAKPEASPEANPEAKPDPQLLTYGSSLYYPNTYTSAFNSYIPSWSAYPYSTYPFSATHLIKKRSPQLLTHSAYVPTTYSVPTYNPYIGTTYLGNNVYPGAVDVVLNQHLIKKRSAQLPLATPWAGAYASSWNSAIPSLYNSYIPSTAYLGNYNYPGVVGLHAIKKRSAQVLAAPALYANSAYAAASPIYSSTYATSPYISTLPYVASPYAYSTFIKK